MNPDSFRRTPEQKPLSGEAPQERTVVRGLGDRPGWTALRS